MIIDFMVTCYDESGAVTSTITTLSLTMTVQGLIPYSFYDCSITAATSAGDSPAANLNFTTASDGK